MIPDSGGHGPLPGAAVAAGPAQPAGVARQTRREPDEPDGAQDGEAVAGRDVAGRLAAAEAEARQLLQRAQLFVHCARRLARDDGAAGVRRGRLARARTRIRSGGPRARRRLALTSTRRKSMGRDRATGGHDGGRDAAGDRRGVRVAAHAPASRSATAGRVAGRRHGVAGPDAAGTFTAVRAAQRAVVRRARRGGGRPRGIKWVAPEPQPRPSPPIAIGQPAPQTRARRRRSRSHRAARGRRLCDRRRGRPSRASPRATGASARA